MKNIWYIAGLLFFVGIIFVFIQGCDTNPCPGCGSDPCKCVDNEIVIAEESAVAPPRMNVIIDKSGSMQGYFNKNSMRPILDVINELQYAGNSEGTVRLYGDDPVKNHADALLYAKNFSADTDMEAIFRNLIKEVDEDSVPVAFVTDGIFSTKNGLLDAPQMVGKIKQLLGEKANSIGIALFRFTSPYYGNYWIEATRTEIYTNKHLETENRPFYVLVVGPKEMIRHINNTPPFKGENGNYEMLVYNIHGDHSKLEMYPYPDKKVFSGPKNNSYFKIDSGDKYQLGFNFPSCLRNTVKNLSPTNAELKLNGETLKGWDVALQGNGDNVAILTIANINQEFDKGVKDQNELTLTFRTNDADTWRGYYSEDDSEIVESPKEQERTFGLKYLIDAISGAETNEDVKVAFIFSA